MIETDSIARDSSAASVDLSKETSVRELDRSCRMPVLFLLWKSAGWLFLGSLFALLNSFRFYDPDFLSHYSWLTFGRVRAAENAAFIYGFALQSAMGAALWLLVRMGRTALAQPGYVCLGVAFWNFGVLAGVVGILASDGASSYELFEIPKYAVPILFVAYSIVGGLAFVTFWRRRAGELYISQWFLFAALLWFPWIFSAAGLLLHFYPVRGVAQAVIAGWYAAGLKTLVLGSVGLAVIFYLIPKLLRRPLHSRYLALFSFWLLLFFGNGAGILSGTTVPSWISGLSTVMSFFVCFAAIMIGWNLYLTMGNQMHRLWHPDFRFVSVSLLSFLLAGILGAVNALKGVADLTQFTMVLTALNQLVLGGFFSMAVFGIAYYLLPRILDAEWPDRKLVNWHFWVAALGWGLVIAVNGAGGLIQGKEMSHTSILIPFAAIMDWTVIFNRLAFFGWLLLAGSSLLFLANIERIGYRAFFCGEKRILSWLPNAEVPKAVEKLSATASARRRATAKKKESKKTLTKKTAAKTIAAKKKRAKTAAKKKL